MARQARGALRSEKVNEICRAVRILVDGRVREIQLTAQDMSSWGIDRRRTLPYLINKILSIRGQFRLRLGMLNPTTLIPQVDELLPCYQHKKMYAFAHIPVQSGSDSILAAMNRGYTAQDYMDLVRQMREHVPHMWITTDVIVGFPGETSDDFYQTLRLIEYIRPNKVNITRYSPRPGTDAAKLPDMLERDKKERSREMSRLADRLCNENNRPWIGKLVPVVAVEHIRPGSVVCRTPEYRSVIVKEDTSLGSTGYARITGARTHYLMGEMIK
jgi:threonylcarbamoyladenosine tRNA methylthiotransferase CDKAL1